MRIPTIGAGPRLTKDSGLSKSLPGEKRAPVKIANTSAPWVAIQDASKQMVDISVRMQQLDNVTESNTRKVNYKTSVNALEKEIAENEKFVSDPKAIAGFYQKRMAKIREQAVSGANKPVADHVGYAFDMHKTETDPRIDNKIRTGMINNARDALWKNIEASKALLLNTENDTTWGETLLRVQGYVDDIRQYIDDGVRTRTIDKDKAEPLFRKLISEGTESSYMQLIPEYPEAMNELFNGQKKEEFLRNLSPAARKTVRNAARVAYKNFSVDNQAMVAASALFKKYTNESGAVDAVGAASEALNVGQWKDTLDTDVYKAMLGIVQARAVEQRKQLAEYKEASINRFQEGQAVSSGTRSERLARAIKESRDPNSMVPRLMTNNVIATLTQNKERSPNAVDSAKTRFMNTPPDKRDFSKLRTEWATLHFQDAREIEEWAKEWTKLEGGQTNYQATVISHLDKKKMSESERLVFISTLERAMKVSGLTSKDPQVVQLAEQLHKGRVESDLAKIFDKMGDIGAFAKEFFTDRRLTESAPLWKTVERLDNAGNRDIADKLIRKAFDKDIPAATPYKRDYVDNQMQTNHGNEQLTDEQYDTLQRKYYQDIHNAELTGQATNMTDISTELPDGRVVNFHANSHTYKVNGKELASVTTMLDGDQAFPKFDVEGKSAEIAKRRGITQEEVKREWEQKGFLAREWGNKYHRHAMYITGMVDTPQAAGDEKEHNALIGLKNQFDKVLGDSPEHGGWKVIGQEQILANPEAGAAGTCDLILEKDGIVKIVDLKTSKELEFPGSKVIHGKSYFAGVRNNNLNHYKAQLAMYKSFYLSQHPDATVVTELWRANANGAVEVTDMNSSGMDRAVAEYLNDRLKANGHAALLTPESRAQHRLSAIKEDYRKRVAAKLEGIE